MKTWALMVLGAIGWTLGGVVIGYWLGHKDTWGHRHGFEMCLSADQWNTELREAYAHGRNEACR